MITKTNATIVGIEEGTDNVIVHTKSGFKMDAEWRGLKPPKLNQPVILFERFNSMNPDFAVEVPSNERG